MADYRLNGRLALVTGARGRLGPIWIAALKAAGAEVIETDNDPAAMFPADLSAPTGVPELYNAIYRAYRCCPSILVNNAGVDSRPTDAAAYADTTAAMAHVNLLGTDQMCRWFGEGMTTDGGSIINIASLYGLCSPDFRYYDHRPDGWVKDPMYGATKAGIISLTRYYAAKWAAQGVRVNALAPGGIVAPGDGLTAQDQQFVEKYTARIPMGRMCGPEDLAGPLVFLASEASSFVTGHTIPIDGGYLCW
jgi:NAD(P)-dependent dehydrogenase (short-subunit alcohol dehydrogenase family)